MRFFISSVFVIALLSSDLIAVDAKLRAANKKVIHRKLEDSSTGDSDPTTSSGSGGRKLEDSSTGDSDPSEDSDSVE